MPAHGAGPLPFAIATSSSEQSWPHPTRKEYWGGREESKNAEESSESQGW